MISTLSPCEGIREAAVAMFRDAWHQHTRRVDDRVAALRRSLRLVETQIEQLVDRIPQTQVSAVVSAFETRIRKLEEEKLSLEDQLSAAWTDKPRNFDDALGTAVESS